MKALQFVEEGVAEVRDIPVPEIAADEILVASRRVGVCHSDIELLEGRYIIPFSYPVIPGHEWSGEVAAIGDAVTDFAVGDRVVGECVIGDDHFGFSISGAAADYFVVKPAWLHKLPDELGFDAGALVEPFSVAYYALLRAGNVDASDVLVVLGAGPIGLAVTAAAHALGAVTIVVEPSEARRAVALELGANEAVHPDAVADILDRLSGGRGADVVVECSGRPEVMATALELAGFGARIAFIGIDVGRSAPAQLGLVQSKELRITGTIGSPGVWPETLRFLANSGIDLSPLITQVLGASEATDAVAKAKAQTGVIKAHIEFNAPVPVA
ncbi:zinc-binding dehydrogenase [Herbiconiux sp. CPCC 205763]|uniref:Zinc-binding dehydrogenase n=1 Tax=Herbiconiux aconitum TaxID=2970913 RepID=A0ABT2GLN4_9MICO|nr:zinc-binding dehydrogenase [Herbiconiux aconitum]MCS5717134.1 zinc-binding dehydrogenase [Herbiconiux aconitum]